MAKRVLCALGMLLVLVGCPKKPDDTTSTSDTGPKPNEYAEQATTQVRASIRDVTDAIAKQAAVANEVKKDAGVTEAIQQYEALSPDDRVKYVVENKAQWGKVTDTFPNPDDPWVGTRWWMLVTGGLPGERERIDFNVAMAQTDIAAKQIRLTNEMFGDFDAKGMSAIEAYEKMTPQQKQAFIATPNAQLSYYYWNYMYLVRKLALLKYYRIYAAQTEWGYKVPIEMQRNAVLDQQFDLKTAAR
jgi:hypothetical protein